jgi:hypothetical protein
MARSFCDGGLVELAVSPPMALWQRPKAFRGAQTGARLLETEEERHEEISCPRGGRGPCGVR